VNVQPRYSDVNLERSGKTKGLIYGYVDWQLCWSKYGSRVPRRRSGGGGGKCP
jgi:hypothetical protein